MTRAAGRRLGVLTVPNALCLARLICSPLMILMAARDERLALVGLFLALALSDFLDGKLAVLLDQRSEIGPILDTVADFAMYACLLVAAVWIDGDRVQAEASWLALAVGSWVTAVAAGYAKFRRWPSLHAWTAKVAWFLTAVGTVTFLGAWAVWPLRLALVAVAVANVHTLLILRILPRYSNDVPSIAAARRLRDEHSVP